MTKEQALAKIKELEQYVEDLDKPKKFDIDSLFWKPLQKDDYYFSCSFGSVEPDSWGNFPLENQLLSFRNVFKTQEEAEKDARFTKACREIRRYCEVKNEGKKRGLTIYYLSYYPNKGLILSWSTEAVLTPFQFYLEKNAIQAIVDLEEQFLIFFGVK